MALGGWHTFRIASLAVAAAAAVVLASTLPAQSTGFGPRLGVAVGVAAYSGDADVFGIGALGRALVSLESPQSRFSAELEAAYHRFTVPLQRCPTCPSCRCSPEAPPPEVWSGRLSAQWHLRGALAGVYSTAGLGLYTSIRAPGTPTRAGLGVDIGFGVRHVGRGLFAEARCLWVRSPDTAAWLFPVVLGYRL